MSYRVEFHEGVEKDLKALPAPLRSKLMARALALADEPRPPGAEALQQNLRGILRVRHQDHRIAYEVSDVEQRVIVWQIASRREFYAKLLRRLGR